MPELIVSFKVIGKAVPQARPRFAAGHAYESANSRRYKQLVRQTASVAMDMTLPITTPVRVELEEIRRLKSKQDGYAVTRPDLDNIIKALLDGMNGIVYTDDSQVVAINASKRYASADEEPCVNVKIFEMPS